MNMSFNQGIGSHLTSRRVCNRHDFTHVVVTFNTYHTATSRTPKKYQTYPTCAMISCIKITLSSRARPWKRVNIKLGYHCTGSPHAVRPGHNNVLPSEAKSLERWIIRNYENPSCDQSDYTCVYSCITCSMQ
jgi:hypothetical protein